jgi:2-polyprenyl-6-hydroxyphenyl methylase/3-demethylubiquinone-9 3-methyltransferase
MGFTPRFADHAPCKCCGAQATRFGSVDFNKSCEDHRAPPLPAAGIPIEFLRCDACGFVFTVALDDFTPDDFRRHVYNDGYAAVDPDFQSARPANNAQWIAEVLFAGQKTLRILDYGGGDGKLAGLLGVAGFTSVTTYDPFYASERPSGRFDVVTCFEVFEHTPTPFETVRDIRSFLADPGLLVFSTLMQPPDIGAIGLSWWYAAPRNGHVSLYSREAMTALLKRVGLKWGSFTEVAHVAFRGRMPAFARHLAG